MITYLMELSLYDIMFLQLPVSGKPKKVSVVATSGQGGTAYINVSSLMITATFIIINTCN